ncbi:MAG: apolipoprotein N-acyltransferase [bacterium]
MKMLSAVRYRDHRQTLRVFLLCFLTAALYGLASPDIHWHALCWIALVPLLLALEEADSRAGFFIGWLCGTMIHLICFPWIVGTVQRYSDLSSMLSILAWIFFSLYSGLAFGGMALAYLLLTRRRGLPSLLVLPVSYTAMEFLFPFIFPWHLGAGLYGVVPLIQISDIFGVFGVTALLVAVNAALFEVLRFFLKRRPYPLASSLLALLFVAAALAYGYARTDSIRERQEEGRPIAVGIVQADVHIEDKQSAGYEQKFWRRYRALSQEAVRQGAEFVVWPESAVPFRYDPRGGPRSASGLLSRMVESFGTPVLFGSWSIGAEGPRNSAYLLNGKGALQGRYDKVRLLAFGEYMPFSDWIPQLKNLVGGVGDFRPGERLGPLCWDARCFGPLICYEAILGNLSRVMVNSGAKFLVNITNDVWFGDTNCPEQHLMLASFRAVENRVWMVRAANTGISAFVDPTGRILNRTDLFSQAVRVSSIELLDIPTLYKSWGDWFPTACSLLVAFFLLVSLREEIQRRLAQRGRAGASAARPDSADAGPRRSLGRSC